MASERASEMPARTRMRAVFSMPSLAGPVGRAEANAADFAGEAVRVLRDQLNSVGAVGLINARRSRRAHAVAVQEQHDLLDPRRPVFQKMAQALSGRATGSNAKSLGEAADFLSSD